MGAAATRLVPERKRQDVTKLRRNAMALVEDHRYLGFRWAFGKKQRGLHHLDKTVKISDLYVHHASMLLIQARFGKVVKANSLLQKGAADHAICNEKQSGILARSGRQRTYCVEHKFSFLSKTLYVHHEPMPSYSGSL